MRFTLRDAHLIDATTDISRGAITIEGTYIQSVECPEYSDQQQAHIIDATGIKAIQEVYKECKRHGARLILSEVHSPQVMKELKDARLLFAIGKANVTNDLDASIKRSKELL